MIVQRLFKLDGTNGLLQDFNGDISSFIQSTGEFLSTNMEMSKIIRGHEAMQNSSSCLDASMSFEGLFSCKHEFQDGENDMTGLEWPLHVRDRLPIDLVSAVPFLIKRTNHASYQGKVTASNGQEASDDERNDEVEESIEAADPALSHHQTRPMLHQNHMADAMIQAIEEGVDKAEALVEARSRRRGLIVVASLLQNLPNIAGLCRTCESMSCEALVIASKVILQSEEFKRQSVTSERWLRLLEVGPSDLIAFLQEKKESGYTIVAVEQAASSISLEDFIFPPDCVLIIGNEQNGVPASLLEIVDSCVEIPMLGVTRSMNAHVSAAMAIWEYTQQAIKRIGKI